MSNWLPEIDIATDLPSRDFLERMAEIGRNSGFDASPHRDVLGIAGFDIVNFRPQRPQAHLDLGAQLISPAPDLRRVEVELRAARWTPEPPTTEVYIEAARALVAPLLTAYNRVSRGRLRLRFEKPGNNTFKPTARTSALFDQFAVLANRRSMHPLDWRRFYRLVRRASRRFLPPICERCCSAMGFRLMPPIGLPTSTRICGPLGVYGDDLRRLHHDKVQAPQSGDLYRHES